MASLALYLITFIFFVAVTVCSVTSIFLPASYHSTSNLHIHLSYGLTKHCSSITGSCHRFPSSKDCATSPDLCHAWKSASFLIMLGTLLEGLTFVAYLAIFNGGYARKQNGWKILSFLLFLIGCTQLPATLLILHELKTSEMFALPGWRVGTGWILATVSYALAYFSAVIVAVLGKFSPDEYSLIPNL